MSRLHGLLLIVTLVVGISSDVRAIPPRATRRPLHVVVELEQGEVADVKLVSGVSVRLQLLELEETRDRWRQAVRKARVKIAVNGRSQWMESGNYQLPATIGPVRIDCPITRGYYQNSNDDRWGLADGKAARFRLWAAGSPLVEPGTFVYPLRQRWFASYTEMGNEPSSADAPEPLSVKSIYYHSGLDLGAAEGLTEVLSASDGLVVRINGRPPLAGYEDTPAGGDEWGSRRNGLMYILDHRGWYHRYAHLAVIDVEPGQVVRQGRRIGLVGKEGSTLWSHLHYDIRSRQPAGRWGIEDAYPFVWEAYQRAHRPVLLANARPHRLTALREEVTLDGRLSWSLSEAIRKYAWTLSDGTRAAGPTVHRRYEHPGTYSEVLEVSDAHGNKDYDFAVVNVADADRPTALTPGIHASYFPTFGIRRGDPVTFKVLSFNAPVGNERWDFGDGSPPVLVRSGEKSDPFAKPAYAETTHAYARSGHYLVRVERLGLPGGARAIAHLQIRVGED